MAPEPFVFQEAMPDNTVFIYEIYIYRMWIEKRIHPPVLHIVDRGSHLSAATFPKSESAADVGTLS